MEKAYWLGRRRASLEAAQKAVSAEARLIHYDLAGRYSMNAHSIERQTVDVADALSPATYSKACIGSSKEGSDD